MHAKGNTSYRRRRSGRIEKDDDGSRSGTMKFGKRLRLQIEETLPEWRDKFLSYKGLKKLLRLVSTSPKGDTEAEFLRLLIAEVDKFNSFFVEKEEDFVIRRKELHERMRDVSETAAAATRLSKAEYGLEMGRVRRDMVNLHGEMVLLENYSNVNYTGLAKILKKYDKRTGRLLRLPFIERILEQPFFTTDLVSNLVDDLENTMIAVFPLGEAADPQEDAATVVEEEGLQLGRKKMKMEAAESTEPGILRNIVAALATIRELRSGSSTYGHFSLPPLDVEDVDGRLPQPFQPPSPIPIQYR